MHNYPSASFHMAPHRQQGAVLIIALIFLMLLTILAISASGSSLMQEKMVAATRNGQLAQWGSETTLRGAEWRLWSATAPGGDLVDCGASLTVNECYDTHTFDANTSSTISSSQSAVTDFRTLGGWSAASTAAGTGYSLDYSSVPTDAASAQLDQTPVYLIEDLGVALPPGAGDQSEYLSRVGRGHDSIMNHLFRITARSTGGNDNAIRLAQSVFAAKSN